MKLTSRLGLVVQEARLEKLSRDLAWGWMREEGRDLRPRPGRYARGLRTLSVRPTQAVRTTCVRPRRCARDCARHVRAVHTA